MKSISYWASRHKALAITLLILGQICNAFNGISLGATLLENVPLRWLQWCMWLLLAGVIATYNFSYQAITINYQRSRNVLTLAFSANFLLFGLLGGIWSQQSIPAHSTQQVFGGRRIEVVRDTLENGNSIRSTVRSENQVDRKGVTSDDPKSTGGRRVGYVLLALLGVIVAYGMAAIACNILCAGYGFVAALVLYLGLGGLAGSVYFLKRAFQKNLKRRQDMTQEERKRDLRVFWLSWLAFIVVVSLLILINP
ncbi:hypothetical protein IC229_25210 [Spirosoma sp. BT702]|uniref:Uncharacterized protein n=1 Tax=Spirosoma profusum TaxID=2771354 RepID=A0A926XZQ3_9BACT|nr:hypothetical protein [Spirosoma profusum]MBD2703969.1 hypothetical protein [Spirosoma profusum]